MAKIYNYNPKTDGWKKVASEKETVTIQVPQKKNPKWLREVTIPVQHYFKNGKSMCDKYPTEPNDSSFFNDPRAYCSECLKGVREQTKQAIKANDDAIAKKITDEEAEKINVIDYKKAEAEDHPESAKSGH